MVRDMEKIREYVQNVVFHNLLLADCREEVSIVLAGSRAAGYHVLSSDYDLLGLCDSGIYSHVAALAGEEASSGGIDICLNEQATELGDDVQVDMTLFDRERIEQAFRTYNDVVIWIWMNSKIVIDRRNIVQRLKQSFNGYPREVLEQKLRLHWLRDYDLSIHGITYHAETHNVFSVVHALASKIGEFCRLCCLLEAKPFPYSKWLFRACQETKLGKELSPIFERVLEIITSLNSNVEKNWQMVQEAVRAMDTDACDMMEDALVAWGFERDWVHDAHRDLGDALLSGLI